MSLNEKLILFSLVISPVVASGIFAWGKFLLDKPLQSKIHDAEAMSPLLRAQLVSDDSTTTPSSSPDL